VWKHGDLKKKIGGLKIFFKSPNYKYLPPKNIDHDLHFILNSAYSKPLLFDVLIMEGLI
jgi:hypothetical protein